MHSPDSSNYMVLYFEFEVGQDNTTLNRHPFRFDSELYREHYAVNCGCSCQKNFNPRFRLPGPIYWHVHYCQRFCCSFLLPTVDSGIAVKRAQSRFSLQ